MALCPPLESVDLLFECLSLMPLFSNAIESAPAGRRQILIAPAPPHRAGVADRAGMRMLRGKGLPCGGLDRSMHTFDAIGGSAGQLETGAVDPGVIIAGWTPPRSVRPAPLRWMAIACPACGAAARAERIACCRCWRSHRTAGPTGSRPAGMGRPQGAGLPLSSRTAQAARRLSSAKPAPGLRLAPADPANDSTSFREGDGPSCASISPRSWSTRAPLEPHRIDEAERARSIAAAAPEHLRYLHERGIVHRDVKPANVPAFARRQPRVGRLRRRPRRRGSHARRGRWSALRYMPPSSSEAPSTRRPTCTRWEPPWFTCSAARRRRTSSDRTWSSGSTT